MIIPILLLVQQSQPASFVHRLGNDTLAIEQYTRTADRLTGEMLRRNGNVVTRLQYDVVLDKNGNAVSVTFRDRAPNGSPAANQPTEVRLTFVGDSVKREAQFGDSVNTRMIAAAHAVPMQALAFGLNEVAFAQMRRSKTTKATYFGVASNGGVTPNVTMTTGPGDTIRVTNASGTVIFRVDREGRIQSVDGSKATLKVMSTRGTQAIDFNALAAAAAPTGQLSARGVAHGSFQQSVVFINYGRPRVRGRTVWGGLLVPLDTIWRAGANEATHFATSRELMFGDIVVPPGLYTLWIFNSSQDGPQLIINKKVGQWGAGPNSYDPALDLGRVPMTLAPAPSPVEEFTIMIRNAGPGRGALDFAFGDKVASALFNVRQ
jgi:hypothetical protein